MTKLQNYFKDFLPLKYREFQLMRDGMTAKQSVVAELLRICCEGDEVKAMKLGFERILGKPEQVVVIKRTIARTIYHDARVKQLPPEKQVSPKQLEDEWTLVQTDDKVVVEASDAPGTLLRQELEVIGEMPNIEVYDIIENKDSHSVARVFAANVYATAMRGGNLGAIDLLFNHLDGAIADVIRIDGTDTVLLDNYADVAPYDAVQDDNGVWYVERELVR